MCVPLRQTSYLVAVLKVFNAFSLFLNGERFTKVLNSILLVQVMGMGETVIDDVVEVREELEIALDKVIAASEDEQDVELSVGEAFSQSYGSFSGSFSYHQPSDSSSESSYVRFSKASQEEKQYQGSEEKKHSPVVLNEIEFRESGQKAQQDARRYAENGQGFMNAFRASQNVEEQGQAYWFSRINPVLAHLLYDLGSQAA